MSTEDLAHRLGQPRRALGRVVVADQPAVADGDLALTHAHVEAHLEGRAADLADRALDRDLLVEGHRRAVPDVALGEDQAEPVARLRVARAVLRDQRAQERDTRRLEVPQEDDVVEVAIRVEVAEADPLAMHVGPGQMPGRYFMRYVMRPLVRSYGESSTRTRSPGSTRMRKRRILPARCPSTSCPLSSLTRNIRLGRASVISPSNSTFSSTAIQDLLIDENGHCPGYCALTSTPSAGTSVMPWRRTLARRRRAGRSAARSNTRLTTMRISCSAKLAPRQRRVPPPNGS